MDDIKDFDESQVLAQLLLVNDLLIHLSAKKTTLIERQIELAKAENDN